MMRRWVRCALALAMLGAALVGGEVQAFKPTSGMAMFRACGGDSPQACLSYIAGVVDLHHSALAPQLGPMFCPPDEIEPRKIARGVWLWYNENAGFREVPAVFGVTRALSVMFPCD